VVASTSRKVSRLASSHAWSAGTPRYNHEMILTAVLRTPW